MEIEIRQLRQSDYRKDFCSGDIEIDRFFIKFAGQNQFKHKVGSTYVAIEKPSEKILGYATVSISSLNIDGLNLSEFEKFPKYPLPILRIARLGVDKTYQSQGVGAKLLKKMLYIAMEIEQMAGCIGVFVDAKKDAVSFYEKYAFNIVPVIQGELAVKPTQTVMYLSLKTIHKILKTRQSIDKNSF